ncbi:MAG: nucleoside deaminase [Melioribacteraceae bacterium]|nr:nucleoside deaminase [Melioribacteraceae bacterium]MCF8354858.1 nucleoside deaminase [Melioribacteraceae bacterium]MCF8392965.1 nucleoside deaminase [Melioribacteraceae bacterium]MCF8417292.1 nucleoside deaminase [Melioribacteraceae bacterium]
MYKLIFTYLPMLFSEKDYQFMYAALSEAEKALDEDEVPIGAVIVHNDRIIGRGYNQTESLNDSTAHAEMIALTAASNHLQSKFLDECKLYVTVEPCIMCAGAIMTSRIKDIYFGAFEPKFGACGSRLNLIENNPYNIKINIYSGIYSEESKHLLKSFFEKKRNITGSD